jgi:hypothetical protein
MPLEMTAEEAIDRASVLCSKLDRGLTYKDSWNVNDPKIAIYLDRTDLQALRQLIAQARKVERVRADFLAREPKGGSAPCQAGYEWAQDDVIYILDAPDTGGK